MLVYIGKNIKNYRKKQNLSQIELAALIDTSQQQISEWEEGKDIRLSSLQKIAKSLDIPIEELMRNADSSIQNNCDNTYGAQNLMKIMNFNLNVNFGEINETDKKDLMDMMKKMLDKK